jgi:hypothetical protein
MPTLCPENKPVRQAFLFGPQALAFDLKLFSKLRSHLHEAPANRWALDCISELPKFWETLTQNVPKLQHINGAQLLQDLDQALQTGEILSSKFPLTNLLLSPLVVIAQLTQYSAFVRAGLPSLDDTDELPAYITDSTETIGLCTGILSALAVSCSSNLSDLSRYGPIAVRLAMLVGALVDAEQASPDSDGSSVSFSVSWNGAQSSTSISQVLGRFPEVGGAPFLVIK